MADNFLVKVERELLPEGREGQLFVSTSRNGYQWSALTLDDIDQLVQVYHYIGMYLEVHL